MALWLPREPQNQMQLPAKPQMPSGHGKTRASFSGCLGFKRNSSPQTTIKTMGVHITTVVYPRSGIFQIALCPALCPALWAILFMGVKPYGSTPKKSREKRRRKKKKGGIHRATEGCGSKLHDRRGYADVGPCFHLPGQAILVPAF